MKEIDTASVVIKPVATAKEMKQFSARLFGRHAGHFQPE